jgi:hypothetical protein
LLAGTDLVHASNETIAILANAEVTAIDQVPRRAVHSVADRSMCM